MNYFGVGMKYNDVVELDHWLRRRIRMCYWKQWRKARRRIGELIKLGSAWYQAILTGLSRRSYWHLVESSLRLAKTLSTNTGLSKAFLEQQGLVSIRTLWIQIHFRLRPDDFCEPPIAPACRRAGTRMMGGVGRGG